MAVVAQPESPVGSRSRPVPGNLVLAALGLVIAAVWVYIVIRGVRVAFTNDEALSYGLIHGDRSFANTANNQWLNTALMRAANGVLGHAEWALRVPNLLAFGVYGAAVLAILSELRTTASRVIGLVILIADPFLLEFFGLARGYGLSVAFAALAMAGVLVARQNRSPWREVVRLLIVGAAGTAAFYANFASLNFVLAVYGATLVDLAVRRRRSAIPSSRGPGLAAFAVVVVTALGLIPGVLEVQHLQHAGQLYYGGHDGFIINTVGSLVETWGYHYDLSNGSWLSWLVVGVTAVAVLWAAMRTLVDRRWEIVQCSALVAVITVGATLTEAAALDTLYPTDRTALTLIVAFAVLVAAFVDDLSARLRNVVVPVSLAVLAAGAAGIGGWNLARTANLDQTLTWPGDAASRRTIAAVVLTEQRLGRPARPWTLVAGFFRAHSLDYYRQTRDLTWLAPVSQAPISTRATTSTT